LAIDWYASCGGKRLTVGLKHHTSKLPALSALPYVTTFGFRGEALSSLCALCESVTIVTATKETAPLGAIIKLGKDGRVIDSTGKVARPVHPLNRVSTGADGDREVPRSP